MKILVTGSTGIIGSHLCRRLCDMGHQVRALHRSTSNLTLIQDLPVERFIGDITDPGSLEPAIIGVDAVFHAAAQLGKTTPERAHAVTVIGTRNILKAAVEAGVPRVVHTSSVAALGLPIVPGLKPEQIKPPLIMDETHSWNYRPDWWLYGYCKHLAELEVQLAVAKGLDVVIVNPVVVIGPGDISRISGDVILRVANGQIRFTTQGGLNAIHVNDCIDGHLAALERGRTGERYILGCDNMPHTQFINKIAVLSGRPPMRIVLPARLIRGLLPLVTVLDFIFPLPFSAEGVRKVGYYFYYEIKKAREQLGFQAQRNIDQAISESLGWYHQEGIYDG